MCNIEAFLSLLPVSSLFVVFVIKICYITPICVAFDFDFLNVDTAKETHSRENSSEKKINP